MPEEIKIVLFEGFPGKELGGAEFVLTPWGEPDGSLPKRLWSFGREICKNPLDVDFELDSKYVSSGQFSIEYSPRDNTFSIHDGVLKPVAAKDGKKRFEWHYPSVGHGVRLNGEFVRPGDWETLDFGEDSCSIPQIQFGGHPLNRAIVKANFHATISPSVWESGWEKKAPVSRDPSPKDLDLISQQQPRSTTLAAVASQGLSWLQNPTSWVDRIWGLLVLVIVAAVVTVVATLMLRG